MKKLLIYLVFLSSLNLGAQTTTTYSVLSTAYDKSSGSYFTLGSVDSSWFLTEIQDLVVPLNPSTIISYSNAPTYVVQNAGNSPFLGIINNRSINYNTTTTSLGQKIVTYRTYFNLPNLNTTTNGYSLDFKMTADDAVYRVSLNGFIKGHFLDSNFNNIPGVNKPYLLTIPLCDRNFVSGQNYLDIIIADAGGSISFYGEINLSETTNACNIGESGIEFNGKKSSITIFPNPANDYLTIINNGVENNNSLHIIDILGNEVMLISNPSKKSKIDLDISNLKQGFYFIKTNEGIFKFIKQ